MTYRVVVENQEAKTKREFTFHNEYRAKEWAYESITLGGYNVPYILEVETGIKWTLVKTVGWCIDARY